MKFQKKPVIIDAWEWDGTSERLLEIEDAGGAFSGIHSDGGVFIDTLEGRMKADIGDFIIKGVKGEFYPCKPDIFRETYTQVE